jgi:hypothetical protein
MKIRELNMQTGTHIDIVITLGNLMESQGMDPAVLGQDISTPAAVVSQQAIGAALACLVEHKLMTFEDAQAAVGNWDGELLP